MLYFFKWGVVLCYFMDPTQAYKNYEIYKILWENYKNQLFITEKYRLFRKKEYTDNTVSG